MADDSEIGDLTAAATLDGTEAVHVVQGGNSRKATVDAIRDINGLTAKTTPVDADEFRIWDSVGTAFKKLSFANLKAWVLALFNASGSAPVYACRAWVNFNGTGTVAIRASGNVSSITDNGAGDYTMNFTTAMEDANYSVVGSTVRTNSGVYGYIFNPGYASAPTASAVRIATTNGGSVVEDCIAVSAAVFR